MEKPKRIVCEELLAHVRRLPCLGCAQKDPMTALAITRAGGAETSISHPHHVKSRGAGGGDTADNLMPLCAEHHREIHQIGPSGMGEKYPIIKHWFGTAKESKNG